MLFRTVRIVKTGIFLMITLTLKEIETPTGVMRLGATEDALVLCDWPDAPGAPHCLKALCKRLGAVPVTGDSPILEKASKAPTSNLRPAASPLRNALPGKRLACAARGSLRQNRLLRRHRPPNRTFDGFPGRRAGRGIESALHRRSLPPHHRLRRIAHRVRRRSRPKSPPAQARRP